MERMLQMANSAQLADIQNKIKADFFSATDVGAWTAAATASGTVANGTSTAKHLGIQTYSSHASNANSGYRFIINNANAIIIAGSEKTTIIFKTAATITGVTRRLGFLDTADHNTPTDGVYCKLADDAGKHYITGHTASNTTTATTTTKYEMAADTWYRLVIEINADATIATYTLYADDSTNVLWTDSLTANGSTIALPTGAGRHLYHGDVCTLASPSGATVIGYIDYMDIVLPNARRVV